MSAGMAWGGPLLRVAVVGATGAVGRELLALLEARRFPLQDLRPIATDRSLGEHVDVLDHAVPVEAESASLVGMDLAWLCTPREATLEWVRRALEAQVACIDLSGAVADRPDVPLLVADRAPPASELEAPLLACPSGLALAWLRVLEPLREAAGLSRVLATAFESASSAGRAGIASLEAETMALFNQRDVPESEVFDHGVAFDCVPEVATACGDALETTLRRELSRLLGELPLAVCLVRVPTFAGSGATFHLETERPLDVSECADLLAKAPGVSVWDPTRPGPSTRDAVDEADVCVGGIRRDPTHPRGLQLWLAADPVRLSALNALRLAEQRLRSR